MLKRHCHLLAGLLLVLASSLSADSLKWQGDLQTGLHGAAEKGRPAIVYARVAANPTCRELERTVFSDSKVRDALGAYELIMVDVEVSRDLRDQLKVVRVPTIILYDSKGKELARAAGGRTTPEFLAFLGEKKATPPTGPAGPQAVTFKLTAPAAKLAFVIGDFNGWKEGDFPMERSPQGEFTATRVLPEGYYEYKFLVDDVRTPDYTCPLRHSDGYGGFNSVLLVGDARVGPRIERGGVTFYYRDTTAKKVEIAGSFNEWKMTELSRDPSGVWSVHLKLAPGVYEYKYVVDGNWTPDPFNSQTMVGGQGATNSVVKIADSETTQGN